MDAFRKAKAVALPPYLTPPVVRVPRANKLARTRLKEQDRKEAQFWEEPTTGSAEEDARLKVATERLRKLLPRVTAADFETLGDVAEKVAKSKAEGDALRAELGLDDWEEPNGPDSPP